MGLSTDSKRIIRYDAQKYANKIATDTEGSYEKLTDYFWDAEWVHLHGYKTLIDRYEISAVAWGDFVALFNETCDAVIEGLIKGKRTGRYPKGYKKGVG